MPKDQPSDQPPAEGKPADGKLVLQEVVQMTGLSEDYLDAEIASLLGTPDESVNNMTLDQLRIIMLNYLETVNESMNAELKAELHAETAESQDIDISGKAIQPTALNSRH